MRGETIPPTHSCCARISLPRMRGETIPPTHSRCARISLPRMRGETISPTHSRCARISLPRMRGRVGVGARLRDTAGCEAGQRSCAPLYRKWCARISLARMRGETIPPTHSRCARISLPRMRGKTNPPTHSCCARISLPRMRGRVGVGARLRDTASCEAKQRSCAPLYRKWCARISLARMRGETISPTHSRCARISLPRMRGETIPPTHSCCARISLPRMRGRVGAGARLRDTASCEAKQRRGAPLYKGGVRHAALLNVSPNDSMLTAFGFTSQNLPRKSRKLSMRLRACALPVSVW